jgi:hypothetical protein
VALLVDKDSYENYFEFLFIINFDFESGVYFLKYLFILKLFKIFFLFFKNLF